MADKKISQLTAATTPLSGTEVLPIVQSGATVKASVANIVGAGTSPGSFTTLQASGKTALNGASVVSTRVVNLAYNHATDDVFALNDTNASPWGTWVVGPGSGTGVDTFNFYRSGVGTIVALGNGLTEINTPITVAGNTTINNGNLVIGTSGKGIDFSADGQAAGMTSELLDDYEEGTWTPVYETTGGSFTYGLAKGNYIKIGRRVFLTVSLQTASATVGTGTVKIGGLPFSISGSINARSSFGVGYSTGFSTNNPNGIFVLEGQSNVQLYYKTTANGSSTAFASSNLSTGSGNTLFASFEYDVA